MMKVTALIITEAPVGEWVNYSMGYARDVQNGDSSRPQLCLCQLIVTTAMTSLLMELKGNRAHLH
jgi:hypothetical protein